MTPNKKKNPDCDHLFCKDPDGEVRKLPIGGDGNMILCKDCFKKELKFRREYNREMGEKLWDLPSWDSLEVYEVS